MIGHDERQKLIRDYHHEPGWVLAMLMKSTACLLIVIGLAVIGISVALKSDSEPGVAAQAARESPHPERTRVVESEKALPGRVGIQDQAVPIPAQSVR